MRRWYVAVLPVLAAVSLAGTIPERGEAPDLTATRDTCRYARSAVPYYRSATRTWQARRGGRLAGDAPTIRGQSCVAARSAAAVWRGRARAARSSYERWHSYHYDWESWLPEKWQRIGACETGYGRVPGDWRWDSGTFQGAFGFHHSSWDRYAPRADPKAAPYPREAYLATPRQQYEVALAIHAEYGLTGWGCRGA